MSNTAKSAAEASVILARVVQATLVFVAAVTLAGALLGNMNVIAFVAIGIFALVLLGFAGALQLYVGGVRRWTA